MTIDQATGLNFVGADRADNGSAAGVITSYVGSSGTFAMLSCATPNACGTISDIASFTSVSAGAPEFTLANGLSFDLNAPLTIDRIAPSANAVARLTVSGMGVYHLAGYADTAGLFTLTTEGDALIATFSASGVVIATGSSALVLASSASVGVAALPEPASLALLGGFALAAVGLCRRRK